MPSTLVSQRCAPVQTANSGDSISFDIYHEECGDLIQVGAFCSKELCAFWDSMVGILKIGHPQSLAPFTDDLLVVSDFLNGAASTSLPLTDEEVVEMESLRCILCDYPIGDLFVRKNDPKQEHQLMCALLGWS